MEFLLRYTEYQKFIDKDNAMKKEFLEKPEIKLMGLTATYIADFEVYDQRVSNSVNASLDIYIGIK